MIYSSGRPCPPDVSVGKIRDRDKSPLREGGEIEITEAESYLAGLSP